MASRSLRLALRGSRDVLVLALAGADWLHHDHQPHQRGARRQAVPRLVGSHGRQSNFRRTVGVALLVSTYRHVSGDEGKAVGTVPPTALLFLRQHSSRIYPVLTSYRASGTSLICEVFRSFYPSDDLTRASERNPTFSCAIGQPAFTFCVRDGRREIRALQ